MVRVCSRKFYESHSNCSVHADQKLKRLWKRLRQEGACQCREAGRHSRDWRHVGGTALPRWAASFPAVQGAYRLVQYLLVEAPCGICRDHCKDCTPAGGRSLLPQLPATAATAPATAAAARPLSLRCLPRKRGHLRSNTASDICSLPLPQQSVPLPLSAARLPAMPHAPGSTPPTGGWDNTSRREVVGCPALMHARCSYPYRSM